MAGANSIRPGGQDAYRQRAVKAVLTSSSKLVFLDCEMSGGNPDFNQVIQVGAEKAGFPGLELRSSFERKIKPSTLRGAQRRALRIAHYSVDRWKSAVGIRTALYKLHKISYDCLLAGWDFGQDLRFIYKTCERTDMSPPRCRGYIDVQSWARDRLRLPFKPGLQQVAETLKIQRRMAHDALDDAHVTYMAFRVLWRFSPEELWQMIPSLDWTSHLAAETAIRLGPQQLADRLEELAKYVILKPETLMYGDSGLPQSSNGRHPNQGSR